jgi:hypothetical protein
MLWTARHACNPPRASTFFATISSADNLDPAGGISAGAAMQTADARDMQVSNDLLNIWKPSL